MVRLEPIYKDYSACCNDFSLGIECLRQRALVPALHYFKHAYESVHERHPFRDFYLSYYGFARILIGEYRGVMLCRQAASSNRCDADIFYILARAEMYCKNRLQMVRAIQQGMQLNHQHQGLQLLQEIAGYRQFIPIPFLPRSNMLNQVIGRFLRKNSS